MKETRVTFQSDELTLEGLLSEAAAPSDTAVVCHPHPQYGGSMYNNVVEAILEVHERREAIRGLEIVEEPPFLRHFSAQFRQVG